MEKEVTTTKTITHKFPFHLNIYWEIDYNYRNDKLRSVTIKFKKEDGGIPSESLTIASWCIEDGSISSALGQLVYYFKTKEFESMFPNVKFTDPEEEK